ncbi:hypothetical protein A5821_001697 [Enterococcus sp. 7F3_DIV0205]|uniref:Uncharacterized protein n=1 Tax=Candidatus Enterococcus palustris TaxID=1834189 RepID=A0AAQ3W8F4_9ENTE|nr:hypothetical protein [Enterococcus sp. 7F3_DIV0205]OTN86092.1 hypothetical protein A5821_002042 [Enterococcus sp. 7F3_DIV0205]
MQKPEILSCNLGVCTINPGLATIGFANTPAMIAICGGLATLMG